MNSLLHFWLIDLISAVRKLLNWPLAPVNTPMILYTRCIWIIFSFE